MNFSRIFFLTVFITLVSCKKDRKINSDFVIFYLNPEKDKVELFWKNDKNQPLKSILNLKNYIDSKDKNLKFAMNGGMFMENNIPKGLYIENYKILHPIDTLAGEGNFYMKPNGIFYVTSANTFGIVVTENFKQNSKIKFATQSGPMLVNKGKISPIFKKNSRNLNIRNGVGMLKNGNPVFIMSKKEINFYNFALQFKHLGCENALYLDGFVSRAYFPEENWIQKDGNFGVMISVTTEK